MDQDLQKRIDEARAEGYSDEEINAALGVATESKATLPKGPVVPILSQEEKAQMAQENVDAQTNEKASTTLTALGMGAAAVGVPAAVYYGGKAILSPTVRAGANAIQQGMNLAERGVGAMESRANTAAIQEGRLQNRPGFGGSGQQLRPVAPTPGAYAGATPTTAMGPVSPVAPAGMPPAQAPSITAQIRQLAANKVLPMMGNVARGSVGPGMALYSGGLNTNEEEELRRRRMMPPTITR
jgi:hypothetical protein